MVDKGTSERNLEPVTLTEAVMRGRVQVVLSGTDTTQSNSRAIPYAELYSGRTSVMETPTEHRQRAGDDEKRRKAD